jgi:hypothetical protein
MSNVRKLIERFKSLNVDDIIGQAITDTKEELIIRNQAQMYEGERADGSPIQSHRGGPYYVFDWYADQKHSMNPLPGYGRKDHYLTGDYYRGMYATVQGNVIKIGSTDNKALEELGSPYGLNDDNKKDYIKEHLKPRFVLLIAEKTGLPFK